MSSRSGGEDNSCTIEHLRGQQLEVLWEHAMDPEMPAGEVWTNGEKLSVARST